MFSTTNANFDVGLLRSAMAEIYFQNKMGANIFIQTSNTIFFVGIPVQCTIVIKTGPP